MIPKFPNGFAKSCRRLAAGVLLFALIPSAPAASASAPDYAAVDGIFNKYCLDCHSSDDPDAKLVLENYGALMKGSESGPVVVPGHGDKSSLLLAVEGAIAKNGKKIIMPPKKRAKLTKDEIAIIREWIDAGAHPPVVAKSLVTELDVPKIAVDGQARDPINALVRAPNTNWLAIARYRQVEIRSGATGALIRTLSSLHGNVNALAFSADGHHLFAGAGTTALFGEIKEWDPANGKLIRTYTGHHDAVYAVAISPDGKTLASGSYDQKIILWDTATGKQLRMLSGHNGCIFGLAFRPDGKILASASADHTVKLWDVASGARRDTLSQPLKEVYAVAFSPDGQKLVAGGVDNRIRIWQISPGAAETTNPLLDSKFAADGAILHLAFSADGTMLLSSADDRTVRLWDFATMTQRLQLERQPDWAPGLDFTTDGKSIAAGRLDGTLGLYDLKGKPRQMMTAMAETHPARRKKGRKMKAPPPPPSDKPEITRVWPRGMQIGTELVLHATGAHFLDLTAVKSSNPKLTVTVDKSMKTTDTELWLRVKAAPDLPRGEYTITLAGAKGDGTPARIFAGRLPHLFESETNAPNSIRKISWPASYWGLMDQGGDSDELEFHAKSGQTLVFDMSARSIGSPADMFLTLLDKNGRILDSQGEFDGGDPLLAWTFTNAGDYRIRMTEVTDSGSPDFYYRLTMGELPAVVGVFPPTIPAGRTNVIQLIGYNLAGKDTVTVGPAKPGPLTVPLDMGHYRFRHAFKVAVSDGPVVVESEPNDTPAQANPIPVPCTVCGRINPATTGGNDADLFRFEARAGERMILETDAARSGSPVDTKLEVLHSDGSPVERVQLRAVRDSAITFRGVDSNLPEVRLLNWQEMHLNQYLYMEGEVCRFFRAPRGPDSGFGLYTAGGKRRGYFDTSPTDHALDELCYIVEPHPPGEDLQPNGLPVFHLDYVNDDAEDRQLGTDSRLHFTAPATGSYLARVTDNRDRGGPRYFYRLTVRDAHPDFAVTLNGAAPTISPGAGRAFSLTANRIDGYDGDIRVDITGAPKGFLVSTPIVIQGGHSEASGTINCDTNAVAPSPADVAKMEVTATALVDGREVVEAVNPFTAISLGAKPQLLVTCEPYNAAATNFVAHSVTEKPLEVTLAPGGEAPVWIKIKRQGENSLVTFSGENLPHGVIVDNIGLNGVLIPKDENEREIFLHSEGWVPDTDRLFYVKAAQAGEPTSLPVMIHIRRPHENQTASK